MSEKKVEKGSLTTGELASAALSGADASGKEVFVSFSFTGSDRYKSISRFVHNGFYYAEDIREFVYPPTLTDQLHGLSLADQIKRGQVDVTFAEQSQFDFPDGKDDGREPGDIFLSREELSMKEHDLGERLGVQEARRRVDLEKTTNNITGTNSSDSEPSEAHYTASDSKAEVTE